MDRRRAALLSDLLKISAEPVVDRRVGQEREDGCGVDVGPADVWRIRRPEPGNRSTATVMVNSVPPSA
jgi:hypothetical protein